MKKQVKVTRQITWRGFNNIGYPVGVRFCEWADGRTQVYNLYSDSWSDREGYFSPCISKTLTDAETIAASLARFGVKKTVDV